MHYIRILLFVLLFVRLGWSQTEQLLKLSDIHKLMQQIFAQHVDKKSINGEILENSFRIFIEQFDPDGMYLLQGEVTPYFSMDSKEAPEVEHEYRASDYSDYEQINQMLQKAISRARSYRSQLEHNPQALYQEAMQEKTNGSDPQQTTPYPVNEQELYKRIRMHMIRFIRAEVQRFGEKNVKGYESQTLALYEHEMRNIENQYTYRQDNGELLSTSEQENLLALHILKAIAKSLDAHTAFFNASEAYDMRVRLEKGFEGIGLVFQESPRGIVVSHIIVGSPAAHDGQIKIGDILIEIDNQSVANKDFEQVMDMLKGDKGQPVHLGFKRITGKASAEKSIAVDLKRELIVLNEDRVDVDDEQLSNGIIGHITLHAFYQNDQGITSEKDVREAIQKLNNEGKLRGLILDLRENSGGFLSQAVKVAGLFISNGVIVVSKYFNGDEKIYRDVDSHVAYSGPLIVLTSKATASAAEIVAQALQDYGVALIVGDEHTYGKGTIQSQTVTDNKGSSYFKVTVGEYYTVSGKTPQLHGVQADIIVPGPFSKAKLGEEYLEHAIASNDSINPLYKDPLKDINPDLKPWYLKYYVPSLQAKITLWRSMIDDLKKIAPTE